MKRSHPDSAARGGLDRRSFLAASALPAAAVLAGGLPLAARAALGDAGASAKKARPLGIELYSVRGELSKDLPNTLKAVASYGYEVVEFYSPYQGWTFGYAKEVRAMLDGLGLRCLSTHNGSNAVGGGADMAKAIELNQILGARYIIVASASAPAGVDGWKKLCERFSAASEELKPHGLATGYHNHGSEWAKIDGDLRVMDVLAANTPKEFVLQLDVGTCVEAGADPVAWVNANPGRIKCCHLKDWAPETGYADKGYRVLFNEGSTPWKPLIAAMEATGGVEFYLLEQEGSRFSEFETAKRCLENWRSFRKS
jgi:sugar phosphate isomerase/epimerase